MTSVMWRVRVAALWIFMAVSMSAYTLLAILEPGVLDDVMKGQVGEMEITEGMLFFLAVFWIVPLTMAVLTLILRKPLAKATNLGVGVLAAAMWAWDFVEHLAAGEASFGTSMLAAGMVLAGLGVLWHAWRWPGADRAELPFDELTRTSGERVPASR